MKKVIDPESVRRLRDIALQTLHTKLSEEWNLYRTKMFVIYTATPQMTPIDPVGASKAVQQLKESLIHDRTLIKYLCDQIRALNTPENYSMKTSENTYIMVCYDDLAAMGNTLDELCEDDITLLANNDERDNLVTAAIDIANSLSTLNGDDDSEARSWVERAYEYMTWLTSEEENEED